MLRLCLSVVFLFVALTAFAQENSTGIVYESRAHVALPGITVQNLNNKKQAVTDNAGKFSIAANVNDHLVFNGFGYKPDTVLLTDMKYREVFMDPIGHMLNQVDIKANGDVSKQAFSIPKDPEFHGQTMNYQRNVDGPYADGSLKGGVNLRFHMNHREEKDRRKMENLMQADLISTRIAKTFSRENIARYVPLKDKELDGFIMRYSPNAKTFNSAGFNLAVYLNKCYQEFIKLPAEERQKTSVFN